MRRELWKPVFLSGSIPPWPCPTCGVGTLALDKADYHDDETRWSRDARTDDFWEPDWQRRRFVCLFYCNRSDCRDVVTAAGIATMSDWDPEAGILGWEQTVQRFLPAPQMIGMPSSTPDGVKAVVLQSYALYWSDPVAAGNRIRTVIERLLDHLRVRKTRLSTRPRATGRRKRIRLSLHQRIEELRARHTDAADHLLAIKWLGNDASHGADLDQDDVLDGLELLEEVLGDIFGDQKQRLAKVTKEIIRRKGRRSR